MAEIGQNWARNFSYSATELHEPRTLDELQQVVADGKRLKALGTRHSFSDVADTDGELISTRHFAEVESIDPVAKTVTIGAGIRYGELCGQLDQAGFALPNLASLPHISVGGSVATATHGSGLANRNLASSVRAVEMVVADGSVVRLSRDDAPERFEGVVVGIGALGVIYRLTLDLEPTFTVEQRVYLGLPYSELESHFEEIESSGYSVSLFTDWSSDSIGQVWVKRRSEGETWPFELFGAKPATRNVHPIPDGPWQNCTEQMGVPGPWYERLPHFRLAFTPSSGEELQSEFFVGLENALPAIQAIRELHDKITPLLHVTELRTIAADGLWMSPHYKRASLGIHFTWKKQWEGVRALLPEIEERLCPFGARPHWGKLFTMGADQVAPLYEKLPEFRKLASLYDPEGKFRNDFLERVLG